jgi:hypothetical protein
VLKLVKVRADEEEVGAGLDGEETGTGDVDAVGVVEVWWGGRGRGSERLKGVGRNEGSV